MIRIVTLDKFEPEAVKRLCSYVFAAYGLGTEFAGELTLPESAQVKGTVDAVKLVEEAPPVASYADDKVVYLTSRPFAPRELPSGKVPTHGYARFGGQRAVVSAAETPKGEAGLRRIGKQMVHDVGHLWGLHHCLDPRCSLFAPWTLSFQQGEPVLCTFCRDRSEQKMRLAKS